MRRGGNDPRARDITGVGRVSKPNHRFVFLFSAAEKLRQPRCASDQHHENSSRKRIQRAGVADAPLADDSAHARNDIVRGHPRGLIDD